MEILQWTFDYTNTTLINNVIKASLAARIGPFGLVDK